MFKLFNFKKNKENELGFNYEETLVLKFNKARPLNKHINILVITDIHGELKYKDSLKDALDIPETNYDLCAILGDLTSSDYEEILKHIKREKIVCLLGNHDSFDLIDKYNLKNINGKIIEINGLKIAGIEGSYRYKDETFPSFNHEESITFLNKLEKADILLSHDGPFIINNKREVHDGLKGITYYLYKNEVAVNIHGHNHIQKDYFLKNGTRVIETYLIDLIKL